MEPRALKMFGSKVRELRKERGMSQEAIADAANVNRSYLSEIEQGIVERRGSEVINQRRCGTF
jgi:transcriptional regulator with XRE-family HTH domain